MAHQNSNQGKASGRPGTKTARSPRGAAVADPHPSTEEHYNRIARPGGANPPRDDTARIAVASHDGGPEPRPENVETEGLGGRPRYASRRKVDG